jgi:hypothetical protein
MPILKSYSFLAYRATTRHIFFLFIFKLIDWLMLKPKSNLKIVAASSIWLAAVKSKWNRNKKKTSDGNIVAPLSGCRKLIETKIIHRKDSFITCPGRYARCVDPDFPTGPVYIHSFAWWSPLCHGESLIISDCVFFFVFIFQQILNSVCCPISLAPVSRIGNDGLWIKRAIYHRRMQKNL